MRRQRGDIMRYLKNKIREEQNECDDAREITTNEN